jgi:hypothetical protein
MAQSSGAAETAIRDALMKWTGHFNVIETTGQLSGRVGLAFGSAALTLALPFLPAASAPRHTFSVSMLIRGSLARHALMQDRKLIRQFRPSAGHTKEVGP